MKFESLWNGYKFPSCETCKKDCQGHLDYGNLCSNLNYLKDYAEVNYEKNKESFNSLKRLTTNNKLNIFSFGCGLGFDYIGANEIFGNNFNYYGIDEGDWVIKKTNAYKNFTPKLPKTISYDNGMFLLNITKENPVICFFNSLFTISNNSNLKEDLVKALENKNNFYIICDYTINNNYHMPKEEMDFLKSLRRKLNSFHYNSFEILDGKGIILSGKRK